jgi:hypothetical protein
MNEAIIGKIKKWNKSIFWVNNKIIEPFEFIVGKEWNPEEQLVYICNYLKGKVYHTYILGGSFLSMELVKYFVEDNDTPDFEEDMLNGMDFFVDLFGPTLKRIQYNRTKEFPPEFLPKDQNELAGLLHYSTNLYLDRKTKIF